MKKTSIIFSTAAFIVIGVFAARYAFVKGDSATSLALADDSASSSPFAYVVPSASSIPDYLDTAADFLGNVPTGTTLAIGTPQGVVTVNNFYAPNSPVNVAGDIVLAAPGNYFIVYDPSDSDFWIGFEGNSYPASQAVAEQNLVNILGISDADACKLAVTEGIVYSAGNALDGQSFPLSFCN